MKDCGETSNANAIKQVIEMDGIDSRFSIEARMNFDGLAELHPVISSSPASTKELRRLLQQIKRDLENAKQSIEVHVLLSNTDAMAFLEAISYEIRYEIAEPDPSTNTT